MQYLWHGMLENQPSVMKHNTEYKGTRKQLDQELIVQFPIAREYLDIMVSLAMNVKALRQMIS